MSGNKWWSTKVAANLLSDLVMFSTLISDIPLDFHDSTRVVLLKYLMYFLVRISTKWIWNIPKEKYFTPLRILNLSIKSFVNPFVDIALAFFDSSFDSFLFDVIFLLNYQNLFYLQN